MDKEQFKLKEKKCKYCCQSYNTTMECKTEKDVIAKENEKKGISGGKQREVVKPKL